MYEVIEAKSYHADYVTQVAALSAEQSLLCLEAMSRRVLQIGYERAAEEVHGPLDGVRRNDLRWHDDFYFYNPEGYDLDAKNPKDLVPTTPADEYELLDTINKQGKQVRDGMTTLDRAAWSGSFARQSMVKRYVSWWPRQY
jgi:hypothetical protein